MSIADDLFKLEELRRTGALSEAEFAKAKAAILSGSSPAPEAPLGQHLADQLAEVKYQNELARIDREWEMEREQYLIRDRYGATHVPTQGMGVGAAVVGGVFGVFWTIMAIAITGSAPDVGPFSIARIIFPLFGVLFTVAAIAYGINCTARAAKYQQAYEAYQARRADVKPEQFQ
jgi:hypothetical protein